MSSAGIFYLYIMPGRRKSSRQRGSSFSGTITRSRATILLLVDRQNAGPSKVLTTERLVFFRDHYEIESGQGNDTASVPRGRQTERPAITRSTERLVFSETIRDGEGERAHYLSVATFFWSSFTIIATYAQAALLNLI